MNRLLSLRVDRSGNTKVFGFHVSEVVGSNPEAALQHEIFFQFQSNLILTSKYKEVSRTDTYPFKLPCIKRSRFLVLQEECEI